MTNKTLKEYYEEHKGKVADKWSLYLAEYERIFHDYQNRPLRLLEIGVQNGGSLEVWARYFPKAKILVGCDINMDCSHLSYEDPRITIVVGDANSDATQTAILGYGSTFDVIIDDGSHFSSDVVKSFVRYFPYLADSGVFVAEDLHCSYWQEYEGGLFDPFSSMSFFKHLADIVNQEHWGVERKSTEILRGHFIKYGIQIDEEVLKHLHSVEFVNSICIIRKSKPERNRLGPRFIAGSEEQVVPGRLNLHSNQGQIPDQKNNVWNTPIYESDENLMTFVKEMDICKNSITDLNCTITALEGKIATLSQTVSNREDQITALYNSKSWRITRPMRIVLGQMKWARQIALNTFKHDGGLKRTIRKAIQLYRRQGLAGIWRGFEIVATSGGFPRNDYPEWIRRYDTLTDKTRIVMRKHSDSFVHKKRISLLMPTYNPKPKWLMEAIESVRKQIYPHWELCIADDASTDKTIRPILERYARMDARIKVVYREQNGHISAASNSALELATGEWIALLDHDDLLAEHALFMVVDEINRNSDVRLIYSDEDKIDFAGRRFDPYFKCDWNPDLFYSHNLIAHLGVYQAALFRQIGGFRLGVEGAQDYDLALRYIELIEPNQIQHIPYILYHWRIHAESTAQSSDAKPYALLAGKEALNDHFQRQGIGASVEQLDFGMYRIRYSLPDTLPLVTLIIPTRNGLELIQKCVESIIRKTSYSNYEILIIDNGSDDPATLQFFKEIETEGRVRVVRDDRPFNYSALNNAAVGLSKGEIIGLINNDLEVISPDWLSEMVSHALRPGVGVVGAKLWYPNDTLQHGGVITGLGGVAGHSHKHLPLGKPGYFWRANLIQSFSAVTAACLIVRKDIYNKVGGLNEKNLKIAFNDVDFCLRVRQAGYRNIWTPYAELYHHESATRGMEDTSKKQSRFIKEIRYMNYRWGDTLLNDPAYSPNLTMTQEDFSLAWPPRVKFISSVRLKKNLFSRDTKHSGLNRVEKALVMVDRNGLGLEIGPSHNPLAPKKEGFNVHVLDHASADELREKYAEHGVNLKNIEEVDYIWRGEPFCELIGYSQYYDWIIASNVIEHTPDLISFLQDCEKLLKSNGVLSLIIPDKRFCFDYLNPTSSTGEVLDAFEQKRKYHSPGKVFDHFANATTKNGQIAWDADTKGSVEFRHTFTDAKNQWHKARAAKEYIDVHNWRFTLTSFNVLLSDLQELGLTGLEIKAEFDTVGFEFFVTLGRRSLGKTNDRLKCLKLNLREN